jgi:hypothetical protein
MSKSLGPAARMPLPNEVRGSAPKGQPSADQAAAKALDAAAIIRPAGDNGPERDADVTGVTPKTPAERSRRYRKRKRDALTEALVTSQTVTSVTPEVAIAPVVPAGGMRKGGRPDPPSLRPVLELDDLKQLGTCAGCPLVTATQQEAA